VEIVAFDTPREPVQALAKLRLPAADLETRFGLRFEPVDHDLGPTTLALARLSSGTVIGFARLAGDPQPGVDVYQYGNRPPSEVLAELVTEAGLAEDDITWSSSDEP
jgi:hypothetical protein